MLKKIVSSLLALCFLAMQSFFLVFNPQMAVAQEVVAESVVTEEPSIIISAIQITGGVGKTSEDFVELYNASAEAIDLNGFRLVKRTATATTDASVKSWSTETIIQPHHFYLWANSSFVTVPIAPDATTSSTLADNNGIALRQGANDTGIIHDSLAWGNTANGFDNISAVNPGAGESLARSNLSDLNSGFTIRASIPRNSLDEFVPEEPPVDDPPVEEPPAEEQPPSDEPPINEPPTEDNPPTEAEQPPAEPAPINIKITELLPNPTGEDSGFEKVELFNAGTESVNLSGFKLDDVSSTEPISSNAYVLPELNIAPGEYLSVTIPGGKFALNNTDGDVVTLIDENNASLSSIFYEGTATENQSYSYFSSGWQWAASTFGQNNGEPPASEEDDDQIDEEQPDEELDFDNSGLVISEIFPQPETKDGEFVEIYNSGTNSAELSKVSVWVGTRHKFLPSLELKPGNYFVIVQSALPVQLRNSGQEVKLVEDAKTLSTVTYPIAVKGASFALFEDGFLWTTNITKSAKNILQLPEEIKKKSAVEAAKTTEKKVAKKATTATKKTTAKSVASTKNATASNLPKPSEVKENSSATDEAQTSINPAPTPPKTPLGKIIAMGAAAVSAGIIALYKLVFTPGVD